MRIAVVFCLFWGLSKPVAWGQSPEAVRPEVPAEADPVQTVLDRVSLRAEAEELVRRLDAPDLATRDAAERRLLELGTNVLDLLPTVDEQTPAEVKERLARVRERLQTGSGESLPEPTTLMLQGEFALPALLEEIRRQTGNRIIDYRDRTGREPVSSGKWEFDIREKPFWPALDEILDTIGLTVYRYVGEPRTLALTARPEGELPRAGRADYEGLFRIEATEISARRDLRNPRRSALRLRIEVLWEPRLTPLVFRHPLAAIEATTDTNERIPVDVPQATPEIPVQETVSGIDLIVPFQLPPRNAKKIERLKGQFHVVLPGTVETFTFESLATARNIEKRKGAMTVTLERVRKNGSVYEFRIRLRPAPGGVRFESHLNWAANNEVYLIDDQGERIENPNYERYLERDREIGFAYLFPVSGDIDKYRLVYRTPVRMINQSVDYELTDLLLP